MSCLTRKQIIDYIDERLIGTQYVYSDMRDRYPSVILNPDRDKDTSELRAEYFRLDIRDLNEVKFAYWICDTHGAQTKKEFSFNYHEEKEMERLSELFD